MIMKLNFQSVLKFSALGMHTCFKLWCHHSMNVWIMCSAHLAAGVTGYWCQQHAEINIEWRKKLKIYQAEMPASLSSENGSPLHVHTWPMWVEKVLLGHLAEDLMWSGKCISAYFKVCCWICWRITKVGLHFLIKLKVIFMICSVCCV